MSILEHYQAYAEAFEQTYEDDDWSRIEPFFTADAIYEAEPETARGNAAVMAKLKAGIDQFDRKMDSRTPDFQTPTVDGNTLKMDWQVTFALAGCPDLSISGRETAVFEGDQIAHLRDDLDAEAQTAIEAWIGQYGAKLQGG